jgi:hypothetical protein
MFASREKSSTSAPLYELERLNLRPSFDLFPPGFHTHLRGFPRVEDDDDVLVSFLSDAFDGGSGRGSRQGLHDGPGFVHGAGSQVLPRSAQVPIHDRLPVCFRVFAHCFVFHVGEGYSDCRE